MMSSSRTLAPACVLLTCLMVAGCGSKTATHRTQTRTPTRSQLHKPVRGLPAVVCKGEGRAVAATPNAEDYQRMKRETQDGKRFKMPSSLDLHRLKDGTLAGGCFYGPGGPSDTEGVGAGNL